jgi:hypothetical protein
MAKINLTDPKLKSLKPIFPEGLANAGKRLAPGERYALMDNHPSGFGVRVSSSGRRTFVLRARYPGPDASQHYSWRALGEYPVLTLEMARKKAGEWILLIKQGKDPAIVEEQARIAEIQKQKLEKDNTFKKVAETWFETKLIHERKGREVERDIRANFFGEWADRPITDISEDDVFYVIKKKSATAPSQARNLLSDLRRLFQWAIDERRFGLTVSPCEKINTTKIVGKKKKRRRVLDDYEILAF